MTFSFILWKSIWHYVKSVLILFLFLAGVLYFFYQRDMNSNLGIIIGVIVAFELPITGLFLQYLSNDYQSRFSFEKAQNQILYQKNKSQRRYAISDITKVECTSTPFYKKRSDIKLYPQDGYFYYTFYFPNGERLRITSLMIGAQLINEANFKGLPFEKKTAFFPFFV